MRFIDDSNWFLSSPSIIPPIIEWGKDNEEVKLTDVNNYIYGDSSGLYLCQINYKRFKYEREFVKFNDEGKKEKSLRLDGKVFYNNIGSVESEFYFHDKLFAIEFNRDPYDYSALVQEINPQTFTAKGDLKEIFHYGIYASIGPRADFQYQISDDRQRMAIIGAHRLEEIKTGTTIEVKELDEDMNEIWKKTIFIDKPKYYCSVESSLITKSGDVVFLVKMTHKKEKPQYQLYVCQNQGKSIHKIPVNAGGFQLHDINILSAGNDSFICTGLYDNEETKYTEGVYYAKCNFQGSMIHEKRKDLTSDFFPPYLEYGRPKKLYGRKFDRIDRNIERVDYREDGSCVLIIREVFVEEAVDSKGFPAYRLTSSNAKVLSLDKTGETKWKQSIEIKMGAPFSSFTSAIVNDKIYILFNDDANDTEYYKTEKIERYSKWKIDENIVSLAIIDSEGHQTRKPFLIEQEPGLAILAYPSSQISDNELMLLYEIDDEMRFAKITFPFE